MYADYPISRELLHWESQSNTSQKSETGQNLIHHLERGYTILVFARDQKDAERGHRAVHLSWACGAGELRE